MVDFTQEVFDSTLEASKFSRKRRLASVSVESFFYALLQRDCVLRALIAWGAHITVLEQKLLESIEKEVIINGDNEYDIPLSSDLEVLFFQAAAWKNDSISMFIKLTSPTSPLDGFDVDETELLRTVWVTVFTRRSRNAGYPEHSKKLLRLLIESGVRVKNVQNFYALSDTLERADV